MAKLIALPSLAMSPMAFSTMASNLHRALRAWFREDASCSRDARDCSSSAWTSEEQARTRSHGGLEGKKKKIVRRHRSSICTLELLRQALEDTSFSMTLRMAAFRSCLTVASCTTIPA
jgi:hypothetical protein